MADMMKCWKGGVSVAVLTVLGLAGCAPKPVPPSPAPPATYAVAKEQNVPLTINTFGNCVTVADVTLQAQVTGTLTRFAVEQGALVKAGDLVAEIDPAPFQAALQEAKGSLDSAQAQLANADATLQRQQQLYKTKTVDLADLQNAEANQLQAQGSVLSAQGQLANAQINLGYCTIKSPITGKAGVYMVDAGNLVTASKTELINIQTIDPIYVDFTVSENDFNTIRQYFTNGELPIEVTIPGAPDKVIPGKLTFINNSIASNTGTLSLRGTFSNPDALLWPGLFVNVRLILTTVENAVTVPSMCVMVGQTGPYVFKINADDTVALQPVTLGQRRSDFAVVTSGVSAGDRVVTAGQLGLVTGKKVVPTLWQAPAPLPARQDAAK